MEETKRPPSLAVQYLDDEFEELSKLARKAGVPQGQIIRAFVRLGLERFQKSKRSEADKLIELSTLGILYYK